MKLNRGTDLSGAPVNQAQSLDDFVTGGVELRSAAILESSGASG